MFFLSHESTHSPRLIYLVTPAGGEPGPLHPWTQLTVHKVAETRSKPRAAKIVKGCLVILASIFETQYCRTYISPCPRNDLRQGDRFASAPVDQSATRKGLLTVPCPPNVPSHCHVISWPPVDWQQRVNLRFSEKRSGKCYWPPGV